MNWQRLFDKWFLPFAGLVVGAVIAFGIYRGLTAPGR